MSGSPINLEDFIEAKSSKGQSRSSECAQEDADSDTTTEPEQPRENLDLSESIVR
jgi:hypothetical protein